MTHKFNVVPMEEKYGKCQVGVCSIDGFSVGDIILDEVPLECISNFRGSSNDDDDDDDESEEKTYPHHIYSPGVHNDKKKGTGAGGLPNLVRLTCGLIMHHSEESKEIVEKILSENESWQRRIKDRSKTKPPCLAYADFRKIEKGNEAKEYWDLLRFETLYVYLSHNHVVGRCTFGSMSIGLAYSQYTRHFNHSCLPNATMKLLAVRTLQPNRVYVVALRTIRPGEEITISYTQPLIGYGATDLYKPYVDKRLGFNCLCGYCVKEKVDVPWGYDRGEIPKSHGLGFKELIQSFCAHPPGTKRLPLAAKIFNDFPAIFSSHCDGGTKRNEEFDVISAHMISRNVLDSIHDMSDCPPCPELSELMYAASNALMDCCIFTKSSHPIWMAKAVFARLQLVQVKLSSVTRSIKKEYEKVEEERFKTKREEERFILKREEEKGKGNLTPKDTKKMDEIITAFISEYLSIKEILKKISMWLKDQNMPMWWKSIA